MKDQDKDASETVIEGKATPRPGRKKVSGKKNNHTHVSDSSPTRRLFSLRNLIGFSLFALAATVGGYWVLNNLIPPSQDSLELSKTKNEITERTLQTRQQLTGLQEQVDKLEAKIGNLEAYFEEEKTSMRPDTILVQLNNLETRFEDLSNEMSRIKMEGSEHLERKNFGAHEVKQFLDSLWLDSQTGKSLAIYPQLIDTIKSYSVEDKPDEVLLAIEQALIGNLSSHTRLLNDLNYQISVVIKDSVAYNKTDKLKDQQKIKIVRIENTSKVSDPSWAQFFANLLNLRKLPHDSTLVSDSEEREESTRDKAAQKSLLSGANQSMKYSKKIPETLSGAIVYLNEVLDNDTSNISSQHLSKLNDYLYQTKSRQQVDKMINEIYQGYGLSRKRIKP